MMYPSGTGLFASQATVTDVSAWAITGNRITKEVRAANEKNPLKNRLMKRGRCIFLGFICAPFKYFKEPHDTQTYKCVTLARLSDISQRA